MDPRRALLTLALAGVGPGVLALAWAAPAAGQTRGTQQSDGDRGQSSGVRPSPPPPASPPPQPSSSPRLGSSIPQDSRVSIPQDSRSGRGFDPRPVPAPQRPPASIEPRGGNPSSLGAARHPLPERPVQRGRDNPSDPPRNESAIEHARRLDREARDRYGLSQPGGVGGGYRPSPWPRPYYHDYWVYDRYWGDDHRPPYREGWQDDWGNDVGGGGGGAVQDDWGGVNDPGGGLAPQNDARGAAAGDGRGTGLGESTVPMLPPDDVLGDGDLSPALRKALDASAEWRQATAALIRAWAEYAQAANHVLADVRRTPDYRRALAEYQRAQSRVDVLQRVGVGAAPAQPAAAANRAADLAAERLVPAADAAI